jgi:hypothetical protein
MEDNKFSAYQVYEKDAEECKTLNYLKLLKYLNISISYKKLS